MLDKDCINIWNSKKFGLVLSGGGAKGAYQAGAFLAMHELDFIDKVTVVSGTSVGALNTLLFAMDDKPLCRKIWDSISFRTILYRSGKDSGTGIRKFLKQFSIDNLDFSFIKENIMGELNDPEICPFTVDGIRNVIMDNIRIEKLRSGREYYVCAYDIEASRLEYFNLGKLSDEEIINASLASAAIPYFFCPVLLNGRKYADGGISLPTYKNQNSDVTPVNPLAGHEIDAAIVIHLSSEDKPDYSVLGATPVIDIYPSRTLESVKGMGMLDFTRPAMRERMVIGYRDTMVTLGSYLISELKG